jgi:predicted nucleic acid-binding protein
VIDTSALLRLFLADGPLPPALERAFAQGCKGEALLLVPDLCLLECASVLRKQVLRTVPAMELVIDAYELALIHALSVYDATYLALALRHGAGLITAD